jgi:hypothetical protein
MAKVGWEILQAACTECDWRALGSLAEVERQIRTHEHLVIEVRREQ